MKRCRRIEQAVGQILFIVRGLNAQQAALNRQEEKIMAGMDDLRVEVEKVKSAEDSAVVLIGAIAQQLKDALAANDPAAIQAVIDDLETHTQPLAAAVAANTTPPTP